MSRSIEPKLCNVCGEPLTEYGHGLNVCSRRSASERLRGAVLSAASRDAMLVLAGGFLESALMRASHRAGSAETSVHRESKRTKGRAICSADVPSLARLSGASADVTCPDCLALIEKHGLP